MSLNYKEIDLILDELALTSSRIDKINQPDRYSLYVEIYGSGRKQKLLIGLHHGAVRISRCDEKPEMPDRPPRFAQLLRARILGGRILSARQPGGERIMRWEISTREQVYNLWIRLWSGNPNIILTGDDMRIVDVLFRKPDYGEIPGEIYNPDFEAMSSERIKPERSIRPYKGFDDFNSYVDSAYNRPDDSASLERSKTKLLADLSKRRKSLQLMEQRLLNRKEDYCRSGEFKLYGELVQNNLFRLSRGETLLETENYSGERISIPLKAELSPSENSERYFKKYRKYRKGLIMVSKELDELHIQYDELDSIVQQIEECRSMEDLERLAPEQAKSSSAKPGAPKLPGLRFRSGSYEILVGRNSRENDELLRKYARGNDLWLHVRQFPGGFVIIKCLKGKTVPLETLLDGANLALLYSRGKKGASADVHYTEVKNLRRMKGGSPGQVIVNHDKNLHVVYDEKRISRLQGKGDLERKRVNSDN